MARYYIYPSLPKFSKHTLLFRGVKGHPIYKKVVILTHGGSLGSPLSIQFLGADPNQCDGHRPVRQHLSNERKKLYYFPLNPGWLIGILIMVYEIIPIYLGSIIPYITQPSRVFSLLIWIFWGMHLSALLHRSGQVVHRSKPMKERKFEASGRVCDVWNPRLILLMPPGMYSKPCQ